MTGRRRNAPIELGQRYGRWRVIAAGERIKSHGSSRMMWVCRCECGRGIERQVRSQSLLNGHSQSCGCLRDEAAARACYRHGESKRSQKIAEYDTWQSMIQRCTNPTCSSYYKYGKRGITVCERWRTSYQSFLEDMGRRPSASHSLERIDNDKGYGPDNCRWATLSEQANNKRSCRFITCLGRTATVAQWARENGLTKSTLLARLNMGWPVEEAISRPCKVTGRRGTGLSKPTQPTQPRVIKTPHHMRAA